MNNARTLPNAATHLPQLRLRGLAREFGVVDREGAQGNEVVLTTRWSARPLGRRTRDGRNRSRRLDTHGFGWTADNRQVNWLGWPSVAALVAPAVFCPCPHHPGL